MLEIGCGNGLLVKKVAPFCHEYIATDFSQHALDALETYLKAHPTLSHVKTIKRIAHDFTKSERNQYDTIILNSVVQYFPNIEYFGAVLDQCIGSLKSSGKIYVGDIRNLDYLDAFHSDVQYFKLTQNANAEGITFAQWSTQVISRVLQDPELLIAPDYFHWYAKQNADVAHVSIEPRRGDFSK